VLQQVCKRMTDVVSGAIRVGRVGGDEFVIVMPDTKMPLAALVCQGIVRNRQHARSGSARRPSMCAARSA
jgi:GGDEF domain-containing protein